jgi:hypothetical protein
MEDPGSKTFSSTCKSGRRRGIEIVVDAILTLTTFQAAGALITGKEKIYFLIFDNLLYFNICQF